MSHRRQMIAKVHIAKTQLGLDDETYRVVLARITGRSSAKEMDDRELDLVLSEFRRLGWKGVVERPQSERPHVRKVWAIWGALCRAGIPRSRSRAALRAFVNRMTGVGDPEWLDPHQANVVIEGLKAWRARELERKTETVGDVTSEDGK